ncbi:hypothetical protein BOTBODRAFT_99647 [Botryobasidium botryosum FD-172 SS1]|uniref:Protein SQS1 n=1 Tax=Botryobasidium botryosum (strain FD-172 SS1) TaxID=930990 RepID=A0A067NBU6_BOTB1|nr:hypothetical protein BOTBODRAFT_99647 [Botryobasidium botryosum FD-172 SS1]
MKSIVARRKKDNKHLPLQLREQWDRDRAKKAEHKRKRAEARRAEALNPFPTPKSRKGKKKLALGRDDGDEDGPIEVLGGGPITDFISLERQIRVFIADLGGRQTMVLPTMDKESRKTVHLLAECFNLKSKSTGKGKDRQPTLIKTTRSGVGVNEGKVNWILGRSDARGGFSKAWDRRAGKGTGTGEKHKAGTREGDVVGKSAAKISEGNIGYQMLQRLGWTEGDRIGKTAGLADPLTAVIKRSKLGLGATY